MGPATVTIRCAIYGNMTKFGLRLNDRGMSADSVVDVLSDFSVAGLVCKLVNGDSFLRTVALIVLNSQCNKRRPRFVVEAACLSRAIDGTRTRGEPSIGPKAQKLWLQPWRSHKSEG